MAEFRCRRCPGVFALEDTLVQHLKVSHVPKGKFKCPECSCRFSVKVAKTRHVEIYHPKVVPEEVNHAQGALTATNNVKNVKNFGGVMLKQGIKKRVPAVTAVISEDGTRTYPCEYCHKIFKKLQNLGSHLPVHTGERNSVCNMCGAAFKSSSNLVAHKKISHVKGGSHKCEKCSCVFASFLGLGRHKRLFHGENQMMTKKAKRAKSKTVVKLPVQVQLEEEAEEQSENTKEDSTHQMIHTGEKPFICSLCGAAFRLQMTLSGHMETSHSENGRYNCDECSCRFEAECDLQRHKNCLHEDGRVSVLVAVEPPGKISKCSQCPKAFKNALTLQKHMRSHVAANRNSVAGARSVQCPKCRGTYSTLRALNQHMITAHIPEGKKCSICTCSFITLKALKAHAAKVHGRLGVSSLKVEQPSLAAVKALKSRGVTVEPTHGSSDDLSYDDEKPYPCDRCGKNFTTDTSLKNHQRLCAQETIDCDICGESFSIYSNLIRHKLTCDELNRSDKSITENPTDTPADELPHGSSDHLSCVEEKTHQLAENPIVAPADNQCLCEQCGEVLGNGESLKNHQLQCGQDNIANNSSCREFEADVEDWKLNPSVCKVVVERLEQAVLDDLEEYGFVCPTTQALALGDQSSPKVKFNFRKPEKQRIAIGELSRGQKCPDCSKYFRSSNDLRLHRGAVHERSGKTQPSPKIVKRNGKFGCTVCKTLPPYLSRQGAEQHIIRVHTPSKLCPHCDGTFSSVSTLNRHISTKHLKTKRQAGFRRTLTNVR